VLLQTELAPSDANAPSFAVLTERAIMVAALTEELARAGREDDGAARRLRDLARGRGRALAEAALLFRLNGEHLETRWRGRAVRLLHAAATGMSVAPETPAATARFDLLEHIAALRPEAAFAEIAAREPRLLAIREQLLASRARARFESDFTHWLRTSSVVHHDLVALVGHARPDFDPLCSSVIAYAITSAYLADLAVSRA
jgi:hypothetical protein